MAVNPQGFSSFSADAVTYIAQKTLLVAKKAVVFQQLGDKAELPANNSKTFQYTRYERLALPLVPLSDGVTPSNTSMTISIVQAVAVQWGAYVALTDVAVLTIKHPVMVKAIELMGLQAAETVDSQVIQTLLTCTSVNFPGSITTRASLSSTSTDIMSTTLIRKTVSGLRHNGAYEYDGQDYVAVVDPYVEMDISADSTFQTASSYSNIKVLMNGEIGKWMGVRWMRSNFIPIFSGFAAATVSGSTTGGALVTGSYYTVVEYVDPNTGFIVGVTQEATTVIGSTSAGSVTVTAPASTSYLYNIYLGSSSGGELQAAFEVAPASTNLIMAVPTSTIVPQANAATGKNVHFSWFFGKEAYTVIDLQKLETYVTPKMASDSDPLVQRRKAGWKLMFQAVINNNLFLTRCETLSAFG